MVCEGGVFRLPKNRNLVIVVEISVNSIAG